jgi:prepilin-type processing-associated H-X9-DG protein
MHRRHAFSLVELLVVLAVVMVLLAVAVPSLARVRQRSQAARCLVTLRQLSLATTSYAMDFRDCLPYPDGTRGGTADEGALWFNALDRYLSKTRYGDLTRTNDAGKRCYTKWKECPVWETLSTDPTTPAVNTNLTQKEFSRTLKMNTHLRRVSGDFARFSDIDRPARHVLFGDGAALDQIEWAANTTETKQFSMDVNEGGLAGVALRHLGGANIVFADGHASTETLPAFERAIGSKGAHIPSWQSEFIDAAGTQVRSGIDGSKTIEAQGFRRNPAMPLTWSQPGRLYGR